jgi:hypothetical protein
MAVRLSDVKIQRGVRVGSEIQTRGTGPLRELLEVLDRTTQNHFWSEREPPAPVLVKLYYEMQDYVDEIDRFAERIERYIQELERREG